MNSGLTGSQIMRVPRFSVLVSSLRSLGPEPCFIADGRWVLDQAPEFPCNWLYIAFICAVNIHDMASGGESSEEDNQSYLYCLWKLSILL